MKDLEERIRQLAHWMFEVKYLVVFTGAGISTESGQKEKDRRYSVSGPLSLFFNTVSDQLAIPDPAFQPKG